MSQKNKIKKTWYGSLIGLTAGLIASLCCITPLILIFLGLGSASFAFSFVGLKPYFLLASIIFLALAFWFHFRKRTCSVKTFMKSPFVITAISLHLIVFVISLYLLLPLVGPSIFEDKLFSKKQTSDHTPSCYLSLRIANAQFNTLSCASCEAALKYELEKLTGVVLAEIDLTQEKAVIHYIQGEISSSEIIKAVPQDFIVKLTEIDQC